MQTQSSYTALQMKHSLDSQLTFMKSLSGITETVHSGTFAMGQHIIPVAQNVLMLQKANQ